MVSPKQCSLLGGHEARRESIEMGRWVQSWPDTLEVSWILKVRRIPAVVRKERSFLGRECKQELWGAKN